MPTRDLAFVAQGKLHLRGDAGTDSIESKFGRSLRERAAQIHHRHAWKSQGRGAQFMSGMLWGAEAGDPGEFRVAITGVARGRHADEFLYSLETNDVSGIFAVADGIEQRMFHTADFRLRHISLHPDRDSLAASVFHNNLSAHIAVLRVAGSDFAEVTEGDSFDLAPRWVAGEGRKLVFQSAGIGRNAGGRFTALGPFAIQQLDLDSGEMECLLEDPEFDLMSPHKTADGTLYYIRRPHGGTAQKVAPLHALKDVVLFPFRLLHAVFQFFNFFTVRYTGKPLSTSKGAGQKQPDLKQMMIWGNMVNVDRAAREGQGEEGAPALVPSSWQLMRRSSAGKTDVIAKSVLSFDVCEDGSVLYSNGSAIHKLAPGGKAERVLVGTMIEQVAAL